LKTNFNVAQIHLCTECEGPFKRTAIWFQGCDIHCPGCCNPELQAFIPKHLINLNQLIEIISESHQLYQTEGVTFLGGEPTLQQHLPALAGGIRQLGMGVILFTGRQIEQLPEMLIEHCDLIIDGPYLKAEREQHRNLVGSANQKIYEITDRYHSQMDWFMQKRNPIVRIDAADGLYISGDVL